MRSSGEDIAKKIMSEIRLGPSSLRKVCGRCHLSCASMEECREYSKRMGINWYGEGNEGCWHPKGTLLVRGEQSVNTNEEALR